MPGNSRRWRFHPSRMQLSLFERVILANSVMLVGEALAGLWVTSHTIEAHHYLIDTSFLVLATVLSILINALLLRASFRPLFRLLHTIRAVSAGETTARAITAPADSEVAELAQAFNTMLDQLETMRREQELLILQAQEEERRRLALELHDESSQNLTALLVHTEVLSYTLRTLPDTAITSKARERLDTGLVSLTGITQRTLETIRLLAQQLRPSVLDDLGLDAALRWLAEDSRQRFHLEVELHIARGEKVIQASPVSVGRRTPAPYETAIFRIAQESLTNAARHAQAHKVSVSLVQEQQNLHLQICDDGCGFDLTKPRTGFGVFGMRERAALLGGTLTITSHPGQGTVVEAVLPRRWEA